MNIRSTRMDISKMVQAAQAVSGGETQSNSNQDPRRWQPTRDKAGNGYAIIRFLPAPEGNDLPWVRYWDHAFKGPTGQWYIEKSLTSLGQQDPLSELNSKLWNSGIEGNKTTVRERKRNLRYVANVLILQDPAAPENEGQVKLYRFGKKIFDKIMEAMQPQFPDEKPVNPFDFWEGADFTLKIRKVDGYPNYDASVFKSPAPLFDGDDDRLTEVFSKVYDLNEFVDPANYKTYDQLKSRLAIVLGEVAQVTAQQEADLSRATPAYEPRAAEPQSYRESEPTTSADDDDTMAYFARLAADD
jgi:hypothetical protein